MQKFDAIVAQIGEGDIRFWTVMSSVLLFGPQRLQHLTKIPSELDLLWTGCSSCDLTAAKHCSNN